MLHYAAGRGHVEVMVLLAHHDPSAVRLVAADGSTPLHRAAAKGHVSILCLLLCLHWICLRLFLFVATFGQFLTRRCCVRTSCCRVVLLSRIVTPRVAPPQILPPSTAIRVHEDFLYLFPVLILLYF